MNVDDYLQKIVKPKYDFYYDDKTPKFKHKTLNCSDEICPGSHKRTSEIRELMQMKIPLDNGPEFAEKYSHVISKMHELIKDELMTLTGCSAMEARIWIDGHVNFNHLKKHEYDGEEVYYTIDPIIKPKYGEKFK